MAQKRMFDKRITDSDRFTDLPNSSKALYFMAGMSADDRGFFQPRRLQKMCGFTDDDFKILIAKQYFISFESGVMVITDWNKNNYLDKNRITETEYVDELKLLSLINEKYELNNQCLTDVKRSFNQNSIEENSIEENSIDKSINKYFEDDTLNNSVNEWFEYKKQRKDKFTEMGKKKLITQIKNNVDKYGVKAVVNLIDECMANNYQGIIFDKLGKPEAKPRYQIESIDERNRRLGI